MGSKKVNKKHSILETIRVSGKIVQKNEASAKSDFRRDLVHLLRTNGYAVQFVTK
jgi:hypothetical protein